MSYVLPTILDLMEYANDAAMQAAFVTNSISSNLASGASNYISVNFTSPSLAVLRDGSVTAQGGYTSSEAGGSLGYVFAANQTVYKFRWYSIAANERIKHFYMEYSADGSTGWTKIPITGWADGASQSSTDEAEAANANGWNTVTFAPVTAKGFRFTNTTPWTPGGDPNSGVAEIELYSPVDLQDYSEATIKQEGSYALKGMATITGSNGKTLTRTVSPAVNLTDKTIIKFDIRASRTGSNIKLGIHDSGGTTTEITPVIAAVDTWQTVVWDISAVSNANKDAIDSIIITIVNADAANTFYIDNIFGDGIWNFLIHRGRDRFRSAGYSLGN